MKAITFSVNPVGWVTCHWLRYFWPGCLLTPLNGLHLKQLPPPQLPGDDWVRIRTLLGGICGTDLAILAHEQRPNSILQAFSSMPMILGHENVGIVEHIGPLVEPAWKGRRVCVEPTLSCVTRGIKPLCPRCAAGEFGACENFADDGLGTAQLPPGTSIGYNRRTGGSYGEYFVAHHSQLVAVPDALSDELAVLTDPVACSLHAALRADLSSAQHVLVYGSGTLGLALIATLRALGYAGRIDTLDKHAYLAQPARDLGADNFLQLSKNTRARFTQIARQTGASVQQARFGNYMLSGGYDVIFDCVGSVPSINESLKWTRARGQIIMIGTGHGRGADLVPIWFRELSVRGAYGRQVEHFAGQRIGTYQLTHELMVQGKLDLARLLTHKFPLNQFRTAFNVALNKGRHHAVKVAFDFR